MASIPHTRRSFLKRLSLAVGALFAGRSVAASNAPSFYIAGVRYYQPRHTLATGEWVSVVRETHQGAGCFAIYSSRGERIGYAPQEWRDAVERSGMKTGRVLVANAYAVPWRRYRIELLERS